MNKFFFVFVILLFFSANAFAEECETGLDAYKKYGFDMLLMEWNPENISMSDCWEYSKDGGNFCDATQFTIMARKYYDWWAEITNESLNSEETQPLTQEQLYFVLEEASKGTTLKELAKNNFFPNEFKAFLLEDNYSDLFLEDFDLTYGNGSFATEKIITDGWQFKNSPTEPGLYGVVIDSNVLFNGKEFEFGDRLIIEFKLWDDLGALSKRLPSGAEYEKNPLFRIPFDPLNSDGARDYGATVKYGAIQLNDSELFMQPSGPVAEVVVYPRGDFSGVRGGVVLSIDGNAPLSAPYLFSLRPSIPVVLEAHLSEEGENRLYYTLVDSLGNPLGKEEFDSFQSLLKWETGNEKLFDYFAEQAPERIGCSGWNSNNDILSAKMVLNPAEQIPLGIENPLVEGESFAYRSVAFLPFDSAISVQCVSHEMDFVMQSYNGEFFGNQKMVSPRPKQFLGGGDSVLEPADWTGKFSVKDVLSEVKEGRMCVYAHDMGMAFSWNEKAFVDENKKMPDLCKLRKGDVSNILNPVYGEGKTEIINREFENRTENTYWCKPREECAGESGHMFSGKTYDPCEGEDYYCCFRESLESESECSGEEMPLEFDYGEYGVPNAEFLEKILKVWNSPALEEGAFEEMTLPEALAEFNSAGWEFELGNGDTFTKNTDFDPLISLAIFAYESNMGTHPDYDAERKSIGNIEEKEGEEGELESTLCTNPAFDRFCGYNGWWESARHLSWRLEYKYFDEGMTTVDSVIPVYAPAPENDPQEYIDSVKQNVCRWRELWIEYREDEAEEEALASFSLPKIIQKYVKPPKWFTDMTPKISDFVQNKIMFWNRDSDGDGIPDLRDKCPNEKETFNDFKDDDGCPDAQEKRDYLRNENIIPKNRSIQINSVPSDIQGKKVILFLPSDFDHSESATFMRLSRGYFDDFVSRAGLGSNHGLVFVADTVSEYKSLASCQKVRTSLASPTLSNLADREISNYSQFFKDSEECARDYLNKKYGAVPAYENYRVVSVIDSEKGVLYNSLFGAWPVGGLANFGARSAKNRVLSIRESAVVSHELGHTFGFGEQYGAEPYLKAHKSYITNYYPGPMQLHYDFSDYPRSAMSLYSEYPRGTFTYPKCSSELPDNYTNCPEGKSALSVALGGIDCDGRRTAKSRTDVRSPMGSTSAKYEHVFDCFEQSAIRSQWGS